MSIIKAKLQNNIVMKIDITDRITFITGDSGTGKTYIVDNLADIAKSKDQSRLSGISIDQLVVFRNSGEIYEFIANETFERKIVFIDRYDFLNIKTKKIIWNAMKSYEGIYILMSRYPDIPENYGYTRDSFKQLTEKFEIVNNKKIRTLEFK